MPTANQLKYWDFQRQKAADAVRKYEAEQSAKTQETTRQLNLESAKLKEAETALTQLKTEREELENLIRKWDAIKAEYKLQHQKDSENLGVNDAQLENLFDQLDKVIGPISKLTKIL